jgi:hypothetical protein
MSNLNNGSLSSSNVNNWKKPSLAHQQKYNVRSLSENFAPTTEEQQLLDMYEVIRSHERVAARLKEEAARAKLLARNAEYQKQKLAGSAIETSHRSSNKRNRKRKNVAENSDSSENDDDDEDLDDVSDDDDEADDVEKKTLHDRREEKLAELREQVEATKNAMNASTNQVDALREKHLTVTETLDDAPMLKKKQKDIASYGDGNNSAGPSSLIANLTGTVTPTHDFSEKLELTNCGTVLFPIAGSGEFRWTPPEGVYAPNDGAFKVDLNDFDIARAQNGSGNNTVAVKVCPLLCLLSFCNTPNSSSYRHNTLYVVPVHYSCRLETFQHQYCWT